MPRNVHLAAIQPPAPCGTTDHQRVVQTGLRLLDQAGQSNADIACLPEYFNVIGLEDHAWQTLSPTASQALLAEVAGLAARYRMYVILPILEVREETRYNTALLIDRQGQVIRRYDKTHPTASERTVYGITAGDTYPVFDLDFGRIGIMTCYDGHFPEVSRILMLNGAEILFFPSLQRHLTVSRLEVQIRARAVDNCVYLVRSSYGYEDEVAWVPGMMVGKTCIVDFEGTILSDMGPRVGLCLQRLDLDRPRTKERSFGGETGDAREFLLEDRRPETYGRIGER